MRRIFVIFAVLFLCAPAMAADWNFYGSSRMSTFRVDDDSDVPGTESDTDTVWFQQNNSRIGATVQFNEEIGGCFELSGSMGKRKLYGTYKFGKSELLIGQTYTPTSTQFYSNSVYDTDLAFLGLGMLYLGRVPMLQWSMAGFKVALISPNVISYTDYDDEDVDIPKIEIAYKYKTDMFFAEFSGGYQTYTLDGETEDVDIDAYVGELGAGVTFGPVFLRAAVHMGQNMGNYGVYNPMDLNNEATLADGSETNDADGLGYAVVLSYTISDRYTVEAGYGHEESEVDNSNNTEQVDQYYLNTTINIAPGFFIVPEVGVITLSEDASSIEPETFYWGAKWQINF